MPVRFLILGAKMILGVMMVISDNRLRRAICILIPNVIKHDLIGKCMILYYCFNLITV